MLVPYDSAPAAGTAPSGVFRGWEEVLPAETVAAESARALRVAVPRIYVEVARLDNGPARPTVSRGPLARMSHASSAEARRRPSLPRIVEDRIPQAVEHLGFPP